MPERAKRVVLLPVEQASYLDSLVQSGAYASESDVVIAGLEALQARDQTIEEWLREEVLPAYDAIQADPSRLIPAEEVLAKLRSHAQRREDAGA